MYLIIIWYVLLSDVTEFPVPENAENDCALLRRQRNRKEQRLFELKESTVVSNQRTRVQKVYIRVISQL